jgi:linoleoyl-CoA desaturase
MKNLKFSNASGEAFKTELNTAVKDYFASRKITKDGGAPMIIKTLVMMTIYLVPMILLLSGMISNAWLVFALYITSGLGMAGIGMSVMHDALHGSYSKNRKINRLMGYSINLIGASGAIWKVQHNVLHHTYTNVPEYDDDLNTSDLLRFSPEDELKPIHRFQHVYAWFLYSMMTLVWVTFRDFNRIKRYRDLGFFSKKGEYIKEIINALVWKVVYFTYGLALPIIIIPQPWWIVVLAFLCMHFVTGLILSVVFQTAHVMPSSDYPEPDEEGTVSGNWTVHQLATTCNYAPKSRFLSWYIGGLNFQIEHHLMPNICHVHYKGLSKVVKQLATKHGIPYNSNRTFADAVVAHMEMLKQLGTQKSLVKSIQ